MYVLALAVGIAGLAAVAIGNYLQHVVAPRTLGSTSPFVQLPPASDLSTVAMPRAPHLRAVTTDEPPRRRPSRLPRLRRPSASVVLFLVCFAAYATVGGILVLHYGSIQGDAISRVSDAWYVFFSRDPHLSAIGFVWNPLPSVLVMPFFPLKSIWPALTQRGFAGNLASAIFMAGCVVQLRGILRELRIYRILGWVLILIFAVNPMVIYYGANGMTEAFYLFFLLVATRHIMRWLRTAGIRPLVVAGTVLGLAYLVRYEAIPVIAGVGVVVAIVAFGRAVGTRKERMAAAGADLVVLGVAPALAFLGWSLVSYIITGQFLQQFSSQYGNSSQIQIQGGVGVNYRHFSAPVLGGIQMLAYGPVLPLLALAVIVVAWRRRDWVAGGLVGLAATVGFSYLAMVGGIAGPNLRYFLPGLPLGLISIAYLYQARSSPIVDPRPRRATFVLAALVLGSIATATTAFAIVNRDISPVERQHLEWVLFGRSQGSAAIAAEELVPSTQAIAHQIDAMGLPSGAIVTDTFTSCVSQTVMTSSHPHQFVITSDRDFERTLADPPAFHAHYLLVPPPNGYGALDAVTRAYPLLFSRGIAGAKLVKEFHEPACPALRLYHLSHSILR
jgi:hypothetical protein